MNKLITLSLCICLALTGCAGREAHPVDIHQPGDDHRTVESLSIEIKEIDSKIRNLLPKSNKTGRNVALGVGGLLFLPAWFFMDLKNAEKTELKALQARHNYLVSLKDKLTLKENSVVHTDKG